ncbi:MAG: 3'(2'),5'-bisphosphate nucleotidase CysQ, partial [Alphaproteobacteria bacterium]
MPDAEDARLAELLVEAAREASALALAMKARGFKQWTKAHASPVTDADIALDRLLKERLLPARPHFGWLSEETPDNHARPNHPAVVAVAPTDGRRALAGGLPDCTVPLPVLRDG